MSTYTMLIKKGKKEGKLEGKTEVVLNLFDDGFDTVNIARLVKLPEEEVVDILRKNGRLD